MILMGLSYGSSILAILVGLSMLGGFEMAAEGAWMLGLLDYSSRDAFDAGVIAGLIVMSVSTLVALVAYLVRREELPVARYVPPYLLTLLSAVYFVCGATVAYAAWYGDGFNAVGGSFFLTLSTLLPVFVLPAWLVRWSYMLIVALWRWGSAGPYRAGLLTALLLLPIWPAFHYASIVSGDAAETYRYRMSLDTERAPGAARPSTGVVTDAAYELAEFFVEQWP